MLRIETREVNEQYMNLSWHTVGFIENYLSTRNPWQLLNTDPILAQVVKTKKLVPPTVSPRQKINLYFNHILPVLQL